MPIKDCEKLTHVVMGDDHEIKFYDDSWGPLWIARNSIGVYGVVRARTFEDANSICEDELYPDATETPEELISEYAVKVEHVKVLRSDVLIPGDQRHPQLGAFEKFEEMSDYSDNGKLPAGKFIRWETIETRDDNPETQWGTIMDNECFQEAFGFRPNGPRTVGGTSLYAKDLSGDYLEELTPELMRALDITCIYQEED